MPYDLMLFPDTYEVTSDSGVPVFKSVGFVLGLDSSNKVITSSISSKLLATMFLKTLLTRKTNLLGISEGTILPEVLNYPQGSDRFESDVIAAVMDAESQIKRRLSKLDNSLGVTLRKASVLEANSETGKISITLTTSNNETASVILPSKRL
jgi:hypothetical protein